MKLSVTLIARNEGHRLDRCLQSVHGWVDEIVIVINDTHDNTLEICEKFNAKVIDRDWEGFGPQKAFAVEQAQNDWVLCLDADEVVSPELKIEMLDFFSSNHHLHHG